jgi:hypothetical protein
MPLFRVPENQIKTNNKNTSVSKGILSQVHQEPKVLQERHKLIAEHKSVH